MVDGVRRAAVPTLGGAAAMATVAAVGAPQPADVELSALVIEGSSTNPTGAGITDFYGGLFSQNQDEVVTVNFLTGPFGVYDALQDVEGPTVVLSSGWGAANISLLLSYIDLVGASDELSEPLYVLDNNVARPNGGFGTRYPIFGVIGVNPIPTPTSPGARVLDVGYEYDINGNTPAYVLNAVSMANSLATYFDNRLNQNDVVLPVNEDGTLDPSACDPACPAELADGQEFETTVDGKPVVIKQVGTTTYISYRTVGLPLLEPMRTYGGELGNRIAYIIEPALTAVVDYGYPDNDALKNPERYVPARLVPTAQETETFFAEFSEGVQIGIDRFDDQVPTDEVLVDDSSTVETLDAASESEESQQRKPTHRYTSLRTLGHTVRTLQQGLRGELDDEDDEDGDTSIEADASIEDDEDAPDVNAPEEDSGDEAQRDDAPSDAQD